MMKRKQSFSNSTEESFDSLMAVSQNDIQGSKDGNGYKTSTSCEKHDAKAIKLEEKKENDYDKSENNKTAPTNLKMLYLKSQVDDIEFVDCCQKIGLLRSSLKTCDKCLKEMVLTHHKESLDGVIWQCHSCGTLSEVRLNSWCNDLSVPLKDLVTVIYCWTRNYGKDIASIESNVSLSLVSIVFEKCRTVASDYFRNSVSNIGGPEERVFIDLFSENDILILGGVEVSENKNMFFHCLGEDPKRDEVVSALVDNLSSGSLIETCPDSRLSTLLGDDGLAYLSSEWDLTFSKDSPSDLLSPIWDGLKLLDFSYSDLDILMFRKHMEAFKDPFLFFMAVIGSVYHDAAIN